LSAAASVTVQHLVKKYGRLLSIVELFALGLVLVALVPTQAVAQPLPGVVTFGFDVPFGAVG
jgi:hypothetical protein